MTRRLLVLLLALAAFATACGDDTTPVETGEGPDSTTTTTTAPVVDPDDPEARLEAARTLWAENESTSYRLTMQELCFCPETIWTDTIVDGVVVSHEAAGDDSFYDPGPRRMDDLFDEVQTVIDGGFATLELDLDPDTGALERYWVDVEEMMADEEHGVDVVSLRPFDGETNQADIDVTTLTDDYGCGYGFALGSPEQDLALVIRSAGGTAPDTSSPVAFPSEDWTGELRSGSDLFSNWCDDVIDASEPVPVVDTTWELGAGTLTIEPIDADLDCGGEPLGARLTGGVVTSAAGETIELGDLDLVNTAFGCFAG